jgi:hypothetical protein
MTGPAPCASSVATPNRQAADDPSCQRAAIAAHDRPHGEGKHQNAQNWMIGVRPSAPTTHVSAAPIRQGERVMKRTPPRYSRSRCVSDQRTAASGGKAAVLAPTGPAVVIAGAVTCGARSMNSFPPHNSTRARWSAAANRVRRSGRCRLTLLTALARRHPQQPEICGSAWEPSCPERGSRRRPGQDTNPAVQRSVEARSAPRIGHPRSQNRTIRTDSGAYGRSSDC